MNKSTWRILALGVFGIGIWLIPVVAYAASVRDDIVEPSPTNFQSWTFKPGVINVGVGDMVTWTNTGQNAHTVTADNGTFDSGNLIAGGSFSFSFAKPGAYTYKCSYHPWMKGTVQVNGAAAAATPTATTAGVSATRTPTLPTVAPTRATPVSPPVTASPSTDSPTPIAASSPALTATVVDVSPTSTTEPPTPTTIPPTVEPAPATPTTFLPVAVGVTQPSATVVPQPRPAAPTTETRSSLEWDGPIVGLLAALALFVGIGGVIVSRKRSNGRTPTTENRPQT